MEGLAVIPLHLNVKAITPRLNATMFACISLCIFGVP